ncbi:porin [Desulfobacter latus]|uniref:Porin n=1 Tax=Desulfobacter latus TaxID=2292 RepID=A0A850SY14_9BACT|nr:porin [Desulfobacter latus]NWH06204.1 porin [Desulfobacter latus]
MKKLVIGVVLAAFLAVAGSAQAATVFKKDNFTYKIGGDWQIQFRKEIGDDEDFDVEYDDLEIKNYAAYKINDNLTAFGELDFGFKNAADKSDEDDGPHLEEAYLGIKFNDFKLMVGETTSAGDEFGVQGTKETVVADDCFDEYGAVDGDDLIKIETEFADMVTVVAAYELEADSEKSHDNGEFFDIFVALDIENFSAGVAFQNMEPYGSDEDYNIWGIQAGYDAGFASFGVDYSATDAEDVFGEDGDVGIFNVAVAVPVEAVTFGAGYVLETFDDDDVDDINGWYFNAIYKFPAAKNVRLFAEIGDTDEDDSEIGYLVGMRIKF